MRTTLRNESSIILFSEANESVSREFYIEQELGRGASCIAYQALDRNGLSFVLKECIPSDATRNEESGEVRWGSFKDEMSAKSRFRRAFEIQKGLQANLDLMNTNAQLVDGLYSANGTLYSVTGLRNASTYDSQGDDSLQEIFFTLRAIARSVGMYHKHGYLHLDIKPENVMVYPETRDLILLLDYDSVVKKEELSDSRVPLSYSNGFVAPELLQNRRNRICEATDIYSIGAILYQRIFARTPDSEDRSAFSTWSFEDNPFFERMSPKVARLTTELLRHTLSAQLKNRYQSMDELIKVLDELIKASDPERRFLNSTCPEPMNLFVGREEEIETIHTTFSSESKTVFLHGMGGMGKTELALNYVLKYQHEYDAVAFGRYTGSIEELFKDTNFISVNEDDAMSFDSVRGLLDEYTLLVIDNFDTEDDPMLKDLFSLKCRILLTSRYDFSEVLPNAKHILVGALKSEKQQELFERVAGDTLSQREKELVPEFLRAIEGYTLCIPLVAKHLKVGLSSFDELYKLIARGGISATGSVKVSHYKDEHVSGAVYEIVRTVLNSQKYTEEENVIINSLALLGNTWVKRNEFIQWVGTDYLNAINSLHEKSCITIVGNGRTAQISIHKILAEIVLSENKPRLEDFAWLKYRCIRFVEKCDQYAVEINLPGVDDLEQSAAVSWFDNHAYDVDKFQFQFQMIDTLLFNCKLDTHQEQRFVRDTYKSIVRNDVVRAIFFMGNSIKAIQKIVNLPSFKMLPGEDQFDFYCLINIHSLACVSNTIRNRKLFENSELREILNWHYNAMVSAIREAEMCAVDWPENIKADRYFDLFFPVLYTGGESNLELDLYDRLLSVPGEIEHFNFFCRFMQRVPIPNDYALNMRVCYESFIRRSNPQKKPERFIDAIFSFDDECSEDCEQLKEANEIDSLIISLEDLGYVSYAEGFCSKESLQEKLENLLDRENQEIAFRIIKRLRFLLNNLSPDFDGYRLETEESAVIVACCEQNCQHIIDATTSVLEYSRHSERRLSSRKCLYFTMQMLGFECYANKYCEMALNDYEQMYFDAQTNCERNEIAKEMKSLAIRAGLQEKANYYSILQEKSYDLGFTTK